jgi:hypothetical protein
MSVYTTLKNDATVQALTTKVYLTQATGTIQPPYIVISLVNINPQNLLAEVPNIEQQTYAISCISTDQSNSIELYEACRDALEPTGYVQGLIEYGSHDFDTGFYRTLFDFSYWKNR